MGGRPPDKNSYLAPFSRYLHIYAKIYAYSLKSPIWLTPELILGYIPTQNSRFMGGCPPDKNSYLAPFSCYLHIYAIIHDFMYKRGPFALRANFGEMVADRSGSFSVSF